MQTINGRIFSDEILTRIRDTLQSEPQLSRRQLSIRVCEWMDWRNQANRLQTMSCRKALLELHRRQAIELRPLTRSYAFHKTKKTLAPPPTAVIDGLLADLGEVALVPVISSVQSGLWRSLLDAHHYLRSGPLCGAQLRYLIHSARYGWLGGLSFSACARRVECRDAWIGWTEEARKRNHPWVVNNSRFLIAPTVKVKSLASHVLAKCQARLADDWEARYGYRPVLLETYVERGRFEGTCYRAANWLHLGSTSGRGRQGSGATVKDIYVRPLTPTWQSTLGQGSDGQITQRKAADPLPPRNWIEEELGEAPLGDKRLTARLLQITGMFYARPLANIPQACGSAMAAKATYRFLDNPKVDWQALLQPHYEATEERIRTQSLVLVAQDTTTLNYSTHPHTGGLGPIGTDSEKVRGLMVHDTLALTPQGTPLGLLNVQCWARDQIGSRHERHRKPIEEKESWKWIESYQAVSALQQRCRQTSLVLMADREADIHELFAEHAKTPQGAQLLIRAERSRNRQVLDGEENVESLWGLLEQQPVIGTRVLLVPPKEQCAKRLATLEVRTLAVTLRPPIRKPNLPSVPVWAVLARETHPPEGVEPLEWMLLTTVSIQSDQDALVRLEWYARRWGIEIYHRILKSGCCIESRQLEEAHRLRNCLAIDMIVAWRIYYLTSLGEKTPEVPCTVYFSDSEWKALVTFVNRTPNLPPAPPSLNEAVRLLGKLGGYLDRSSDDHPGSEVLWRGMARLADVEVAYDLYHD